MTRSATHLRLYTIPLLLSLAATCAAADFKTLLGRLPGEANAIAVIDVEKLLNSPLGQKQHWADKVKDAYGDKPFVVAPGAKKVALAALIDPSTMDSLWEVSIMDLIAAPAIDNIARGEHGLPDTVGDKPAAWSPMNAYFVQLDTQLLGAVYPGNRQFASRWARKKQVLDGSHLTAYLRNAAAALDSGAAFALAIDLEDCVNPRRAMARIKSGEFNTLTNNPDVDPIALSKLLASIKGLTLRVDVADEATIKCTLDFGADTLPLSSIGKPLFIEILSRVGARLDDVEGWSPACNGNVFTFEGKLSLNGLRTLFSIIEPPAPAMMDRPASATPPPDGGAAAPPTGSAPPAGSADAAASQAYFASVDKSLQRLAEGFGAGAKGGALSDGATWVQRDARRIARLPILGVDPDLVAWGGLVADRMQQISSILSTGSVQARSRSSSIVGNYSNSYYDYDYNNANEMANVEGQRRSVSQQERANAISSATPAVQEVLNTRDQIRAQMVQRYNVEF